MCFHCLCIDLLPQWSTEHWGIVLYGVSSSVVLNEQYSDLFHNIILFTSIRVGKVELNMVCLYSFKKRTQSCSKRKESEYGTYRI